MSPSKDEILEREQRWAVPTAASVLLAIALLVASVVVQQSLGLPNRDRLAGVLLVVHRHAEGLLVSGILRAIGVALLAVPLVFLFMAIRDRNPTVNRRLIGAVIGGPVALGAALVLQSIGLDHAASQFVSQNGLSAKHPEKLAKDLQTGQGTLVAASALGLLGTLAYLVGSIYTANRSVRTGLLTPFWGTLGMAASAALGLSFLFPPLAVPGLLVSAVWFGYVGLLAINRSRGRRPAAWEAGQAVPWVKRGEQPADAGAAPEAGDVVEGQAAPVPRQRGERRKRKRRDPGG